MNFLYHLKEKGKFVLLLLILLIIEILSSNSQSENVSKLNIALNELYSDRLIAQDYIYKISETIHLQKEFLLNKPSSDMLNETLNRNTTEISKHLNNYEKTSLTKSEASIIKKFKSRFKGLNIYSTSNPAHLLSSSPIRKSYITQLDSLSTDLKKLSEIQISRGLDLKNDSIKTVSFSNIINQLSSVLFIITGLYIIAVVFTSKSTLPKFQQQERLN